MEITLDSLGISRDELISRLVNELTRKFTGSIITYDEVNEEKLNKDSLIAEAFKKSVKETLDSAVEGYFNIWIHPSITKYLEDFTVTETNKWGEAKSEPVKFKEYIIKRAESFLTEPVNREGKTRKEYSGYDFKPTGSRLEHFIIDKYTRSLHGALEVALSALNKEIAGGLEGCVKNKIAEVTQRFKLVATGK